MPTPPKTGHRPWVVEIADVSSAGQTLAQRPWQRGGNVKVRSDIENPHFDNILLVSNLESPYGQ
jgi:hypothetical protein